MFQHFDRASYVYGFIVGALGFAPLWWMLGRRAGVRHGLREARRIFLMGLAHGKP